MTFAQPTIHPWLRKLAITHHHKESERKAEDAYRPTIKCANNGGTLARRWKQDKELQEKYTKKTKAEAYMQQHLYMKMETAQRTHYIKSVFRNSEPPYKSAYRKLNNPDWGAFCYKPMEIMNTAKYKKKKANVLHSENASQTKRTCADIGLKQKFAKKHGGCRNHSDLHVHIRSVNTIYKPDTTHGRRLKHQNLANMPLYQIDVGSNR